jgi:hypothetical protein
MAISLLESLRISFVPQFQVKGRIPHLSPGTGSTSQGMLRACAQAFFSEISEPIEGFKASLRPHGKGDSTNMF